MNQVDEVFRGLRAKRQAAFIPFVTAGDPDLPTTIGLVRELSRRGADIIELGIPYSDPIADGPVIQASYARALAKQIKLDSIFQAVRELTAPNPASTAISPLVCMVAYSIVYRRGVARFVQEAKESGFAGAIVPDLPVDEAGDIAAIALQSDFKLILLVTPTTPRPRAVQIAQTSSGFLYYVSITGITGERSAIPNEVVEQVSWLKTQTDLPVCIGFGISQPEQVRQFAPVADGVIVGSAIVRRIADGNRSTDLPRTIGDYVATLIAAIH